MSDVDESLGRVLRDAKQGQLQPPTFDQIGHRRRRLQRRRQGGFAVAAGFLVAVGVFGMTRVNETDSLLTADAPESLVNNATTTTVVEIASSSIPEEPPVTEPEQPKEEEMPRSIAIPPLSGALIDDAISLVEAAGLVAQIVVVDDPTALPEYVISVDPSAGTEVNTGSTVVLTVQGAVDEPLDPEEQAFLELQNLVNSEPELFVGYYIDEDGSVVVATSSEEAEAQRLLEGLSRNYSTVSCPRSQVELMEIVSEIKAELQRMETQGASAFGIDARTCTVHLQASLTSQEEAELLERFGDAVTIDPEFSIWTRAEDPENE